MNSHDTPEPQLASEIYERLSADLVGIQSRWLMFRELYMGKEKRVALLNAHTGFFFEQLQLILRHDVMHSLCAMTDPVRGKREESEQMVLGQLPRVLQGTEHVQLTRALRKQAKECFVAVKPIRDYRNLVLAHRDKDVALGRTDALPTNLSIATISGALQSCGNLLNDYQLHFRNRSTHYGTYITNSGADALVRRLVKAHEFDRAVAEELIDHSRLWRSEYNDA